MPNRVFDRLEFCLFGTSSLSARRIQKNSEDRGPGRWAGCSTPFTSSPVPIFVFLYAHICLQLLIFFVLSFFRFLFLFSRHFAYLMTFYFFFLEIVWEWGLCNGLFFYCCFDGRCLRHFGITMPVGSSDC